MPKGRTDTPAARIEHELQRRRGLDHSEVPAGIFPAPSPRAPSSVQDASPDVDRDARILSDRHKHEANMATRARRGDQRCRWRRSWRCLKAAFVPAIRRHADTPAALPSASDEISYSRAGADARRTPYRHPAASASANRPGASSATMAIRSADQKHQVCRVGRTSHSATQVAARRNTRDAVKPRRVVGEHRLLCRSFQRST